MHQFSEEYFENLGFKVIGVKSKSVSTRNGQRVFKSWFGMLPIVCATVWYHLEHTKALIELLANLFLRIIYLWVYTSLRIIIPLTKVPQTFTVT